MKLERDKDFTVRSARLSDQAEVLSLWEKHGIGANAPERSSLFVAAIQDPQSLFKVALNSNGVLISFLWCQKNEWKALVFNPNFKKQELQVAMLEEARQWANQQSTDQSLQVKPKLIHGDLKAFIKKQGIKLTEAPPASANGFEILQF